MQIITYRNLFFDGDKSVYAKYDDAKGWGLYASQQFSPGDIILKLHVNQMLECNVQKGPTFGDCKSHGIVIAPNVEWCPTRYHPFWNFNHSCNPNSGFTNWGRIIDGYIPIIAYNYIEADEHITFDYSTVTTIAEGDADGSPWIMNGCFCGDVKCRGVISEFHALDDEIKYSIITQPMESVRYGGILAHLLLNEKRDMIVKLKNYSIKIYCDFLEVLVEQLNFSRHFLIK